MVNPEIPSDRAEKKRENSRDSSLGTKRIARIRKKVSEAKKRLAARLNRRREL